MTCIQRKQDLKQNSGKDLPSRSIGNTGENGRQEKTSHFDAQVDEKRPDDA